MYHFNPEKHIHTFDDKPLMGTSTACKIIAKPLTWWAAGMSVGHLGWINSKIKVDGKYKFTPAKKRIKHATPYHERIKELTVEEYVAVLDDAYNAHNKKKDDAAEAGTERHAILEKYVKHCIDEHDGVPYKDLNEPIQSFIEWSVANIKKFLWSEVHGYSKEMWTGGIADVGWEDMEGKIVAGDFKSSKEAYFDQYIQIGGYDLMLTENGGYTADGEKIFTLPGTIERYCVIPFGQKVLDPQFIENVSDYKEAFKAAVHLYKLQQQYERSD